MTIFPFSSWIVSFNFKLHSSRLHSPAPRKNGAEFILREFAARTWLFLKRKLHQGLLFLIPRLNIVVQAPPKRRPPLGNSLMSMSSHSLFVSLNFAFWPSRSNRKKRSSSSSEITSCDKGKRKTSSINYQITPVPRLYGNIGLKELFRKKQSGEIIVCLLLSFGFCLQCFLNFDFLLFHFP